ncbi:prepilin peptidase, partial [Patescibacteria group bacterium]|nr:prepilin peptidase [Patescibacteria group bacterium]
MLFIILVAFIVFIFGASIGSFISASIYRMRKKETIMGRSYCPKCGYKLAFFDLFPLFSFIFLRGKCRKCKEIIDWSNFIIEFVLGIIFVFSFFYRWIYAPDADAFSWVILRDWTMLGGLSFLFIYDLKYKLLPDKITLPLIVILFILNVFIGINILNILLAIGIGAGFFLLQYLISGGKWIGDGDIRLGAVLGAGLGFPQIISALLIAYIFGAVYGLILIVTKKAKMKSEVAFGTFLAVGGVIALFFGNK